MKTFVRGFAVLSMLAVVSAGGIGCNTFRGAGTDIKRGGEAIEGASLETGDRQVGPGRTATVADLTAATDSNA